MRKKIGRPPKYNEEQVDELVNKFEEYIYTNPMPIVAEFASLNGITRTYLYERQEFLTLIEKSQEKKQVFLEKMALQNKVNPTMAIFSLKQLGWRDKQELAIDPIKVESTSKLTDEQLDQIESILKGNK